MKTKCLAIGIILLFVGVTIAPAIAQNTKKDKIIDERFLFDREHNPENSSDTPTVLSSTIPSDKKTSYTKTEMKSGSLDLQWPVMSHDVRHTGRSPFSTATAPLVEKWRFPADGWIFSSPVINQNGTIYFSGYKFFTVSSNGTLKWKTENFLKMFSAPGIDEQGIIYAGAEDSPKNFYAFYPNGIEKWRYPSGIILSSPVIDNDGDIYFGEYNGNLIALYPNGTLKWSSPNIYSVYSSPALGDDGTIYCTSWYNNVYALYPNNGTVKWQFPTGGRMKANPSIADDGTIYISSWDDYLYALYPNGTLKWRVNTYLGASSNPSIGPDGTIYIAHDELYAVNPDGTVKWIFPLGTDRHCTFSAPAVSADGIIYVGVNIGVGVGGELIIVNPDGTERWRSGSICNEGIVSSPAIAKDGTIYIGSLHDEEVHSGAYTSKGFLHAFGPGETKKVTLVQPVAGKFYFLGVEKFSTISGKTVIVRNVTVRATVTNIDELDHVGFFVDGNLQYNCTEPLFEWNMDKNYYRDIVFEHHRIRVTAFYKGGCEWSDERFVVYIRLF